MRVCATVCVSVSVCVLCEEVTRLQKMFHASTNHRRRHSQPRLGNKLVEFLSGKECDVSAE